MTYVRRSKAASVGELPSIYPDSALRGHAQSTFDIGYVTQRDQSSAMFGWDHCRRAGYSGRVANRKQRGELFSAKRLRMRNHGPSMAPSGSLACSILLRSANKATSVGGRWRRCLQIDDADQLGVHVHIAVRRRIECSEFGGRASPHGCELRAGG